MDANDRIALHRRMAESWYDGYRHFPERRELILSDEWRFTDEAVYWSPYFSGGRIHPVGKFFKTGLTFASGGSMETSVSTCSSRVRPIESSIPRALGLAKFSRPRVMSSSRRSAIRRMLFVRTVNGSGCLCSGCAIGRCPSCGQDARRRCARRSADAE